MTGKNIHHKPFVNNRAQHKPSCQSFTANIQTASFGDRTVVAVSLTHRRRMIDQALIVVGAGSPERAWYHGYQKAQQLADAHSPDARLYIYQERAKANNLNHRKVA